MQKRIFKVIIESSDDSFLQLEQMLEEEKDCGYIIDYHISEEENDPEQMLKEEIKLTT